MAYTLIDWANMKHAEFVQQRASLRRFQRVLCRLGIHLWHRTVHLHPIIRRFNESSEMLKNLPFKKMDGNEYTYVPRG